MKGSLRLAAFVGVLVAQAGILAGLAVPRLVTWHRGERVVLKLVFPKDPRDLFRGDYVTLRYEISQLPNDVATFDPKAAVGKDVYVSLEKGDRFWRAVRCSLEKPDGLFIKGKLTERWSKETFSVHYGIENYFIPEGTGSHVERVLRDNRDDAGAEIALSSSGEGMLIQLIVKGETLKPGAPKK